MHKTALWAIGCGVAVVGFAGWYFGNEGAAAKADGEATLRLERELRKLKSEVNTLRRQQTQPVVLVQPPGEEEDAPEPVRDELQAEPEEPAEAKVMAAQRKPPTVEEVQAQAAEDFKRYDEFFVSQARDPIWAGETERAISGALGTQDFAFAQVERFQCASSVCRLNAHVDGEGDLNQFVRKFSEVAAGLPQGTFRRVADPAGGLRVEGYFTKPGGRLPPRP